jgi:hypothetical protein
LEVETVTCQRVQAIEVWEVYVLDFGEAFQAEEVCHEVLRGEANCWTVGKANLLYLRGRFTRR